MNEYIFEFLRLASCNQLSESDNQQAARYLGGLRDNIGDKIGMQMVLCVQKARNLALKVGLMYQEKTQTENYRRYGGGDNKQTTRISLKETC